MCIVIDINAFAPVFVGTNRQHHCFAQLKAWIDNGPGKIVYGGTKYLEELKRSTSHLGVLSEYKKMNRTARICESAVDRMENEIERLTEGKCNDCHIMGIISASGCRLICSNDRRADKFIKGKAYYPNGVKVPSIYRNASHKSMLIPQNVIRLRNQVGS